MVTRSASRFWVRIVSVVVPTLVLAASAGAANAAPTARGDTYATPVGKTLTVHAATVSGVLYNDFVIDAGTGEQLFGPEAGLTATLVDPPSHGTLDGGLHTDGSFTYIPGNQGDNANDSFTYVANDGTSDSAVTTVNIHILSDQPDYKITMNYELGMHCTGFEFSYCCILPPYNSIVAQVIKPQTPGLPISNADFPRILEADPINGLDGLGRETVLRDYDGDGNIKKYVLEYYHDAMPRLEGNMPDTFNSTAGKNTLISDVEGNSLLYWNSPYDSAMVDPDGSMTGVPGKLITRTYAMIPGVVVGDGSFQTPCATGPDGCTDNFANGVWNHLYIYNGLEGDNPSAGRSLEADKIRLGVAGMVEYPKNVGAALQPMGPVGNVSPFDNVLTFSGDTGTVVYTQSKVLENLPIQLTSPRLWEALGLPLTPFEDDIGFFADPASVDEDSVRPFVAMKARLVEVQCNEDGACDKGDTVVTGSNDEPVIGFGTAPIDIPNCERCHSAPAIDPDTLEPNVNSPNYVRRYDGPNPYIGPAGETLEEMTNLEIEYWKYVYPTLSTSGNDWYARLKGAAINMIAMHDYDVGTDFSANYPTSGVTEGVPDPLNDILGLPGDRGEIPQNTRMGHESVICQKCHGDNVIAAVKAAGFAGQIPPISEAIHNTHRAASAGGKIAFDDSFGRFGGCQGCHPAHRSDGSMDKYPITQYGDNANALGDNRTGKGGCFVGRDVHSNPLRNVDGAETPSHMNAVGQWLVDNVVADNDDEEWRGIWCTNCHQQLSQEIWRTEDCNDLINGDCLVNPRGAATLAEVASMVGLPSEQKAIEYLDPKNPAIELGYSANETHAAWKPYDPSNPDSVDANVATIEVAVPGSGASCGPLTPVYNSAFGVDVCVSLDGDGDPSVNILTFCTTDDCVAQVNDPANRTAPGSWRYPESGAVDGVAGFAGTGTVGAAVPFSAATDGRDHWLAAGEPHCADCHAAPYTEQSGNINPFPPFNYPAKAGLMRYSRGHQDLSCQSCHESIHGLYPVGPAIDNTSYAQAAALNADGSHGPLKCGACHFVDGDGIPYWIQGLQWNGAPILNADDAYDAAVSWAHTYTDNANVLNTTCQNCHGVDGGLTKNLNSEPADWTEVADHAVDFLRHADEGLTSRLMMDKAEILVNGRVTGTIEKAEDEGEREALCSGCHASNTQQSNKLGSVSCSAEWVKHLSNGRVAESVWEDVSQDETGTNCGW